MISKIYSQRRSVIILLTVLTGIVFLLPQLDYQNYIAQGDHGRDLYIYKLTAEGGVPYRDYSTVYGPLMPYYYASFFKMFGTSIQSVLLGKIVIILLIGVSVYLAVNLFASPFLAYLCACWYWAFRMQFFYTYNHIGGLLLLIITVYCTFKYILKDDFRNIIIGCICCALLTLVKFNFGFSALGAFFTSIVLADFVKSRLKSKKMLSFYITPCLLSLLFPAFVYWILFAPLPSYILHESFPIFKATRTDNPITLVEIFKVLLSLINRGLFTSYIRIALSYSIIFSLFIIVRSLIKKQYETLAAKNMLLTFAALSIIIIFTMHEFFLRGVFYTLIWIMPLLLIFYFLIIHFALTKLNNRTVTTVTCIIFFAVCFTHIINQHRHINQFKNPYHLLVAGPNKVYTKQDFSWLYTVMATTQLIKNNTDKDDYIFAAPFDPIYYFLSERDSATRQLIFFNHKAIPIEQERNIIYELEKKKVDLIILSNRFHSLDPGFGILGTTYCHLLGDYLNNQFSIEGSIGDWQNPAGWNTNHGVRILRRKQGLH